jgi:pyruvate kinase
MINNPRPTRAEMSDVANAVLDQVDCVMLSGETAFGKYPVKVIETMTSIISKVEANLMTDRKGHAEKIINEIHDKDGILAHSLVHVARHVKAGALLVANGEMALALSRFRPQCPIVLITKDEDALRQANICCGVIPYYLSTNPVSMIKHLGLVKRGQRYVDASEEKLAASIQTLD